MPESAIASGCVDFVLSPEGVVPGSPATANFSFP